MPKTKTARALIATDAKGVPVILATDDEWLAQCVDEVSTSAEDVGLCDEKDCPDPGLYLFAGHSQLTYDLESGQPDGSEWVGELRSVKAEEVAELYAMAPPDPEGPVAVEEDHA